MRNPMPAGDPTVNDVFPGQAALEDLLREQQGWLDERGQTRVGSACFVGQGFHGSLHTDYGPPNQDKRPENQDYVLVWQPSAEIDSPVQLAVALADGLTSSYASDSAAALACWAGLRALVAEAEATNTVTRGVRAFNAAGRALGRLAGNLAADPQASCPPGQFLSTWKYILEKGRLLQTTLMLAWMDAAFFHLFMVGDGGACWRHYDRPGAEGKPLDSLLASCDLSTQEVQAVGPATRALLPTDFDGCWGMALKPGQPFLAALHTDGLGRGLGAAPETLLEELDQAKKGLGEKNEAQEYIRRKIEEKPKDFADNLSLVVVRGFPRGHP